MAPRSTRNDRSHRISLRKYKKAQNEFFGDIASQMTECLLYAKTPPHLKRPILQAYLENGTYEQTVRHLEREMKLGGLESEETGLKTQITKTKVSDDKTTQPKNSTPKKKQQTSKTVLNNTLQDDQCRYCKDTWHKASNWPNAARWEKTRRPPDVHIVTH